MSASPLLALSVLLSLQQAPSLPSWLEFFVATKVALGFNAAILFLSLAAARNLWTAWRRLNEEEESARRLGKSSPERDALVKLVDSESGEEKNGEEKKKTLAGRRIEILRGKQTSTGSEDDSANEATGLSPTATAAADASTVLEMAAAADAEELHQEVALARAIAAGVVLLGLGGTLVGLSMGLAPLAEVFHPSQSVAPGFQELWGAMGKSVSGMRTAFSTTLSGVLGALALGVALTLYGRKQGRVLAELERACLLVALPAFAEDEGSRLGEAVEEIEALRKNFSQSFSDLTRDIEERGSALSREIQDGFEEVTGEVVHGFQKLISPFEDVRDATLRLVGTPEEGAEPLARQVERLGEAAGELERSVESATRLIPDLRDTLIESFREQSEATRQALDTYYGRMAERVEQQSESTRQLTEQVQRTATSVGSVADDISGFVTAAEDYRRVWKEVADTVRAAEKTLDTRLGAMKQAVDDGVGELIRKQGDVQQRVLTSLTQFETQLADSIEAIERERRRAVSRSEELIRELRDAVKDSIREIDARGEGHQKELGSALRKGLRELQLELRDLLIGTDRGRRQARDDGGSGMSSDRPEGRSALEREPRAGDRDHDRTRRRDLLERAFGSDERAEHETPSESSSGEPEPDDE